MTSGRLTSESAVVLTTAMEVSATQEPSRSARIYTMTATGMAKVMVAEAKRTPEQPAKRITA